MTATALRGTTHQTGLVNPDESVTRTQRQASEDRAQIVTEWAIYATSLGIKWRRAKQLASYYMSAFGPEGFEAYILAYADPTGETAVNEIVRSHP